MDLICRRMRQANMRIPRAGRTPRESALQRPGSTMRVVIESKLPVLEKESKAITAPPRHDSSIGVSIILDPLSNAMKILLTDPVHPFEKDNSAQFRHRAQLALDGELHGAAKVGFVSLFADYQEDLAAMANELRLEQTLKIPSNRWYCGMEENASRDKLYRTGIEDQQGKGPPLWTAFL